MQVNISYLSRALPAASLAVLSLLGFEQLDAAQISRGVDTWHANPSVSVLIFLVIAAVSTLLAITSHELVHFLGFRAAGVDRDQLSFGWVAGVFPATILQGGQTVRALRIGLASPILLPLLMAPMLYTSWGALWLAPLTTVTVGLAGDLAVLWGTRGVPAGFRLVESQGAPSANRLQFEAG